MAENYLYCGDNLDVLRQHIADESVDLIYLDPPFSSRQSYHLLFTGQERSRPVERTRVFTDTWQWDQQAQDTYEQVMESGGKAAGVLLALRVLDISPALLAYLTMMLSRLIELRRVLKPTGSLYLHCDPTASHYLKILMDALFGETNFRNEIIWHYMTGGTCKEHYARKHDVLLFYTCAEQYRFHPERIKEPRSEKALQRARHQKGARISANDTMKLPTDVWRIDALNPMAAERQGYPTQKPLALLERIIQASSDTGEVVLDPFCGSGTTIVAAQSLQRRWIGIDISGIAIDLTRSRLRNLFGVTIEEQYVLQGG